MTYVPTWYDPPNKLGIEDDNAVYPIDGETARHILWVMHRLYDESKPLRGDERRDLAQWFHAKLRLAGLTE